MIKYRLITTLIKEKRIPKFTLNCEKNQSSIIQTERHKLYSKHLSTPSVEMVFSTGPAGTGKTYLACKEAIQKLKLGEINKIIITRPMVCNDEELGFLPGDIESKMDPWTRPIIDIFQEQYNISQIYEMMKNKKIECSPLAYMRGRTFNNSYIIGDEMQNATENQMKMFLTRIGKQSKMVITGDVEQIDSNIGLNDSGLFKFLDRYVSKCRDVVLNEVNHDYQKLLSIDNLAEYIMRSNNEIFKKIKWIEFKNEDIQRNPIISDILNIYKYNTIYNNKNEDKYVNDNECEFEIYDPLDTSKNYVVKI